MSWRFKFGTYSRSLSLGLLLGLSQVLVFMPRSMAQSSSEKGGLVERSCTDDQINKLLASFSEVSSQKQLAKCGKSAIPHLIQILRISQNEERREIAVSVLGKMWGADVTNALIQIVNIDKNFSVRVAAVEALGEIGGADVTKVLIQMTNTEQSAVVRVAAIGALSRIGGPDVAKLLIQIVNSNQDAYVRSIGVEALGKFIEEPNVLSTLISALHDPNIRVRYYAVESLVNSSSEEAVQALNNNELIVSDSIKLKKKKERSSENHINGSLTTFYTTRQFAQRRPLACKLNWFAQLWSGCK
jgi:predicted aspartyl protease